MLGLDRLAAEKRAASASSTPASKRQKVDADDFTDQDGNLTGGGVFKGKWQDTDIQAFIMTPIMNTVPALPIKKDNIRVRGAETPSHAGGISATARERLQERLKARNMPSNLTGGNPNAPQVDSRSRQPAEHRGLGDFQSRLNKGYNREDRNLPRERDQGYAGRNARQEAPGKGRNWDESATPRTTRTERDGGFSASMRIPNTAWDETPRAGGKGRDWDAATPRSVRGSQRGDSPDGGDLYVDPREWEEEQIRLDRDWYSAFDEGGVVSLSYRGLRWKVIDSWPRLETRSTILLPDLRTLVERRSKKCKSSRSRGCLRNRHNAYVLPCSSDYVD